MCDDVGQCAAFQEFHDDPEFVPDQETVIHRYDVRMVVVSHNYNLHDTMHCIKDGISDNKVKIGKIYTLQPIILCYMDIRMHTSY